ncbi:hypothetical protein [Actinokineospora enzanensis]|uniref:hypothetical protein n=1 Tax=Actinokineospora enzanensis TaxID=155975 RepID=UPI00037D4663|nr:hypothetical protein [Actinokineospora enzanensis]
MRWWRNSYVQPKNSPHNVPKNYIFHGTFNPVYGSDHLDYQDYFTFRHNVGSGGTGSLTIAGAVDLIHDY